jgi:hypothetical protein
MKFTRFVAVVAVLALGISTLVAAEQVKSGPQVDQKLKDPFEPLNINGEKAGAKNCLFCSNGDNPVVMIFARELTPEVTKLIKEVNEATEKNKDAKMGSFIVFLNDSEALEAKLKTLCKEEKINTCILAIDNPAGPKGYDVAKDAEVTVVLYKERVVKANHAFRKGELKDKEIETVLKDIPKITK